MYLVGFEHFLAGFARLLHEPIDLGHAEAVFLREPSQDRVVLIEPFFRLGVLGTEDGGRQEHHVDFRGLEPIHDGGDIGLVILRLDLPHRVVGADREGDQGGSVDQDIAFQPLEHVLGRVAGDPGVGAKRGAFAAVLERLPNHQGIGVAVGDGIADEDNAVGNRLAAGSRRGRRKTRGTQIREGLTCRHFMLSSLSDLRSAAAAHGLPPVGLPFISRSKPGHPPGRQPVPYRSIAGRPHPAAWCGPP